ncbi:MAG TPA: hypothetical protein VGW76_16855 [Pyrinomonadaceae bacterium]|nr:hypothetical protein [Pyrinomonadaceae bacterium]
MRTSVTTSVNVITKRRDSQRGAALISVLLFSALLLAAGGALILATSLSASNSIDATSETQAYYASEAGLQATLAVLRGHVVPNPLFDTSSSTAFANKITFRKAVTPSSSNLSSDLFAFGRLSRWLNYNVTLPGGGPGIGLSSPYSAINGLAYDILVEDPDNTANQTYSTLGAFGSDAPSAANLSYTYNSGGGNRATITYTPQASTTITSAGTTLGTFGLPTLNGTPDFAGDPKTAFFTITIRQVSASGTVDVPIKCVFSLGSGNTVNITFQAPSPTSNNISGTVYTHASVINVPSNGTRSVPVTIDSPEPSRVKVTVNGYGPRGARKQKHMLVSRFAFDYNRTSTITLRSADDNTVLTFNAGNSAQYQYSGFDNAGGPNTSAFGVTSAPDYNYLASLALPGNQVVGSPGPIQQIAISSLPTWLQTTDKARELVDTMRVEAQNQNRYFTGDPPSFGTRSEPLFTFIDGDADLPPAGGAGLLIVTGTLTMNGSTDFAGLILVLGSGQLIRTGGGNGNSLGAAFVARFGASGNFLAPTFNSNGSGNSSIAYDSSWVQNALASPGPRILALSEF